MGLSTATKLVSDVLTDVKRTFGDESSIQITDTDIIRWVNSAQREILISNRILKAVGTTDISANVGEYTLDGLNVVAIQSIHFQGRKLDYKSFAEAEEYIVKSDPDNVFNGDPILWYEWGGTINLYPIPQSDSPAGLKIYYIKEPTKLSKTTDKLDVPDAYYENVVQYVLSKAYELDEDSENSQFKLGQFTTRLNTLSEQENEPNQDTYPRITIREEDM